MTPHERAVKVLDLGPIRVKRFKLSQRNSVEILEDIYNYRVEQGYTVEIDFVQCNMYPPIRSEVYSGMVITNPHARADGRNYGRD